MAAQADLDLDAQKPAGKKHLILYIVIGVLVIGMGVMGYFLYLNMNKPAEGGAAAEPAELEIKPAHYVPLETFTVNFAEPKRARYLQVDIQLQVSEPALAEAIEKHVPAIRNDVGLLLSMQQEEAVSSREGKEQLRTQIRDAIQKILEERGEKGSVEAVYFTSFVMQ